MAFRNRIVRLSQLVADTITGAVIQTAATGARIILSSPGAFSNVIQFWSGNASQTIAGKLQTFAGGAGADNGVTIQLVSGAASNDGGVTSSPQSFVDLVSDATLSDAWVDLGPRVQILPSGEPFGNGDLSVAGSIKVGPGGSLINELRFGATGVVSTNASGQVTIAHGMAAAPLFVDCHHVSGSGFMVDPLSYTATTFTVTVRNVTLAGSPVVASTNVNLRWFAIR